MAVAANIFVASSCHALAQLLALPATLRAARVMVIRSPVPAEGQGILYPPY
jgi:chemotaxis protein CheY-P-specific phosphatase CheC